MFNFVVAAGGEYRNIGESRFFEYTDDGIRKKCESDDGSVDFDKLATLPTLMVPEFSEKSLESAKVGYVSKDDIFVLHKSPLVPEFPANLLMKSPALISLCSWENSRTHWAVKKGDLFRILPQILGDERVALIDQSVNTSNPNKVAVMMPFDSTFDNVYSCIKKVIAERKLSCERVDDIYTPTHITKDISNLLVESGVVIVDITGRNPNVMYELGLSHAIGRTTILIAQDITGAAALPFDIKDLRTFSYLNNKEGLEDLSVKLSRCFEAIAL
jgi:hypothetical protein